MISKACVSHAVDHTKETAMPTTNIVSALNALLLVPGTALDDALDAHFTPDYR